MTAVNEVDQAPPVGRAFTLGAQHVLVMYAGAITAPLIVGSALKVSPQAMAVLINADLLCCGIVSLIQALGLGRYVGIRLPVMMGVSFAGIGPMIAIGLNPQLGLPGLYGSIFAAGLICFLLAPLMSKLLLLFPPIVTGTALLSLGVSLLGVAIGWAGGGVEDPHFGSPFYLGMSGLVVVTVLAVNRLAKGFVASLAVLIGLAVGGLVAFACGKIDLSAVQAAPWLTVVRPFQFGPPKFDPYAIAVMTLVVLVTMVESIGLFLSLSEILDRPLSPADLAKGLRADALGAAIGGLFNTFPYTSYGQNIGLVALTGVRSRYVCAAAGLILISLSVLPKAANLVAALPHYVLGGAAVMMFGTVAASGLRILQKVDFRQNRHNGLIFAVSLGLGLIPTLAPHLLDAAPGNLAPLLHSGVLLSVLCAMVLNLVFNVVTPKAAAARA